MSPPWADERAPAGPAPLLGRILQRGAWAALVSGLLLVRQGRRDACSGAAPLNAISHWLWPESALRHCGLSARYTLAGALIHYGASCFWSAIYEGHRQAGTRVAPSERTSATTSATPPAKPARVTPAEALGDDLVDALALTAIAAWVDLVLVPPRLSPGFERQLSDASLCRVYLAFGAGMAWGEARCRRAHRLPREACQLRLES